MTAYTEYSNLVRVEAGPARKVARATPALLDDAVTAPHYVEGGVDATGKRIVIGNDITYLDWQGDRGFYVYVLTPELDDQNIERHRWVEDSFHAEQSDADARAAVLVAERTGAN